MPTGINIVGKNQGSKKFNNGIMNELYTRQKKQEIYCLSEVQPINAKNKYLFVSFKIPIKEVKFK